MLELIDRWFRPNLEEFLSTRQPLVWALALASGIAAAIGAVLFRIAIGLVQWPWLGTLSENVAAAASLQPWWVIFLAPVAGGLVVGLILQHLLPGNRPYSVPEVIRARLEGSERLDLRSGVGSAVTSAISLGSGASAGREGPVVHLGASIAAALCRRFDLSRGAARILFACGVASAVSASFNAPIAGVLFAQEVILNRFRGTTFVPLVIASTSGAVLSRLWFGDYAAFVVPEHQITSYLEFPAFVLLGLVCALVSVMFQSTLLIADRVARDLPMPLWLRPVTGGLAIGAMGVFLPQVLGVGYDTTDAALKENLPLVLLLLLIPAKTLATGITLASRFGGGVFSPSLYVGAMTGGAFGMIAAMAFPELSSSNGLYAILGMGAVAGAVLGAPISTAVMVFELTGGYALTIALLLTVAISNGLSLAVLGRSFFEAQLATRGSAQPDRQKDLWSYD
ncbi:chloride channel protein [Lutibaculum baratangense]|uniref:Chloride channel protein n=1 Tax=Lutibaculum baratangense AMV1 TaxID=631454 RepID=V4R5T0_9HYPH|nr:chloride channel protein [Lutibaculum baratangense]ESR27312.1 Chloride channel protein [Lutibaculum baratangense AMV1]